MAAPTRTQASRAPQSINFTIPRRPSARPQYARGIYDRLPTPSTRENLNPASCSSGRGRPVRHSITAKQKPANRRLVTSVALACPSPSLTPRRPSTLHTDSSSSLHHSHPLLLHHLQFCPQLRSLFSCNHLPSTASISQLTASPPPPMAAVVLLEKLSLDMDDPLVMMCFGASLNGAAPHCTSSPHLPSTFLCLNL